MFDIQQLVGIVLVIWFLRHDVVELDAADWRGGPLSNASDPSVGKLRGSSDARGARLRESADGNSLGCSLGGGNRSFQSLGFSVGCLR